MQLAFHDYQNFRQLRANSALKHLKLTQITRAFAVMTRALALVQCSCAPTLHDAMIKFQLDEDPLCSICQLFITRRVLCIVFMFRLDFLGRVILFRK